MRNESVRFAHAALWPLTIWTSLSHLDEHAADDYVERTSPIVGTAIAFWIGVVGAIAIFGFCASAIPFGLFYVLIQQVLIRILNDNQCTPGVPDIFSWPFPTCRPD